VSALETFLQGTIRTATPLAFAALGETVTERAGIINVGLEGAIIAGALGGFAISGIAGTWIGFLGAGMAGVFIAFIFAFFTLQLRADQIITGTAISLFGLGATATLYRQLYGETGAALSIPTMSQTRIPLLSSIPVIGPAAFNQPPIAYLLYGIVPLVWWWMYRTYAGLGLRSIGEDSRAAASAGIAVRRMQLFAILFGGLMGGIAGGVLVIAQSGSFAEGMSAGRGFIAIAVVVLGRWHPLGVFAAALVFAAASALQYLFQAMGWAIPYQAFLALPYVLTLLGLAGMAGKSTPPGALGTWQGID
jgi:general nucleoside transport system permease protein